MNNERRNNTRRNSGLIDIAGSILHRQWYRQLCVGVPALRTRSLITRPIILQAQIIRLGRHVRVILRIPHQTAAVSKQRVTTSRFSGMVSHRPDDIPHVDQKFERHPSKTSEYMTQESGNG